MDNSSDTIISSSNQTKIWRKQQNWYNGGKSNECEIYQFKLFNQITNFCRIKNYDRLNYETLELRSVKDPNKFNNGFEWSEDFDTSNIKNGKKYYFNMKFVCDKGGAQTRTLREVYYFIKCQLDFILKNNCEDVFFINILDGDESFRTLEKFNYLQNIKKYNKIKKYIFIGDMKKFVNWWI